MPVETGIESEAARRQIGALLFFAGLSARRKKTLDTRRMISPWASAGSVICRNWGGFPPYLRALKPRR
ncbi:MULTISPECIES: hypothetical protein [unclassified Caballeronia]|uniref:hypothetical protein n=1 Tax=unclassified Caballeronia TaxID=2646786 RepID=UPI0002FAA0F3|nr:MULTISPECIES: hypothetical protein [unclassified Caballeronia]MCE4543137.1 hypothetical protein [Caballeronia sp. PC1]MCE4567808.1 hypothetical protein [Caballeronia sp. CLC5]